MLIILTRRRDFSHPAMFDSILAALPEIEIRFCKRMLDLCHTLRLLTASAQLC